MLCVSLGKPPGKQYAHIVVTSSKGQSLLNYNLLHAMCDLEATYFKNVSAYQSVCERDTNISCCPAWSLASYVAMRR